MVSLHPLQSPRSVSGGVLRVNQSNRKSRLELWSQLPSRLSPTTLIQGQFGRTYDFAFIPTSFTSAPANITQQIGLAPSFVCGFIDSGCLVPDVTIPGFLSGGEVYQTAGESDFYQYSADFTKILRNHTIKTGYALFPTKYDSIDDYADLGFNTPQTANPENAGKTGNALASFLLAVPDNATYRNSREAERHGKIMDAYIEDQWKATKALTVNAGLRYDLTLLPPYGLASSGTNAVGDVDLNNGTYILQVDPGPCVTGGKAPCIPHCPTSCGGFADRKDHQEPIR